MSITNVPAVAQLLAKEFKNNAELISLITMFEKGQLDAISTVELFQLLIDTDLVWSLGDGYADYATNLINAKLCHAQQVQDRDVDSVIADFRLGRLNYNDLVAYFSAIVDKALP